MNLKHLKSHSSSSHNHKSETYPNHNPNPGSSSCAQEFDSVDAAAAVMAPDSLDSFQLDGCPLRLEYSASQRPGSYTGTGGSGADGGGGGGSGSFGRSAGVMDWVCDRCSTTNFARCDVARSRYRLCRAPLAAAAPGFARAVL